MSSAPYTVTSACTACGACLGTCPEHCIRPAPSGSAVPLVVLDSCTGCGECVEICPVEACVEVTEVAVSGAPQERRERSRLRSPKTVTEVTV